MKNFRERQTLFPFQLHLNFTTIFQVAFLLSVEHKWNKYSPKICKWNKPFQSDYSIEVIFIALAACGILHVLCGLFCVWSVEWKTLCMCSTLPDARNASLAKVVPTKNNGSTVLCVINRRLKKDGCEELWIDFQQTKYHCFDGKLFQPVAFPVDCSLEVIKHISLLFMLLWY